MVRVAPAWMSGYSGMILLSTLLLNISTFLVYNGYGLILTPMGDALGLSHFQEGSLTTAFSIAGTMAGVVAGFLATRYGTRLVIGVSSISGGIALIFLGTSPTFIFALVMSAVVGLSLAGLGTPAMGLLVAWFNARTRGTAAGIAAAGSGFSFIIIGALVPWLIGLNQEDGWRHVWYTLGIITIVIGVVAVALLREKTEAPERHRRSWALAIFKSRPVWNVMLLAVCSGWCQGLYVTFFGVYLEEEGVDLVVSGRLWSLLGVVSIGSGLLWGTVSDRLGRREAMTFSYAIYVVALLLFWLAPVMVGFVVSVALVALVFRANFTVAAAACADYVAPHLTRAAFGFVGIGVGIGWAAGAPLAGWVADTTGDLGWVFVLAAGGATAGVVIARFLPQRSVLQLSPYPTD